MELTIYNTYVVMESQEQCDRMKQLCIDNGLSIWNDFRIDPEENGNLYLFFEFWDNDFCCWKKPINETRVTEEKFIELLKSNK